MSGNAVPGTECDVASSSLTWGVKRSFREYVERTDGGKTEWVAPAADERFPCAAITDGVAPKALNFVAAGAVHFYAYDGLLDIRLWDITALVVDDNLRLSVRATGASGAFLFAEQNNVQIQISDTEMEITADAPLLSARGASVLGGNYARGTVLDPLRLIVARRKEASASGVINLNEQRRRNV